MTIKELQRQVDDWIKKYGVRYFDVMTNNAVLMEEVGELSGLLARYHGEQSFKEGKEPKNIDSEIQSEIGDVLFVLTCITNQLGYSMEEILENNLNKKTNRDARRHHDNTKLKE